MLRKNRKDWTGTKSGRWTALKPDSKDSRKWLCECSCGTKRSVFSSTLSSGLKTGLGSCGCLQKELVVKRSTTHGMGSSEDRSIKRSTYLTWQCMKRRCYDKDFDSYPSYGGRGIKVCDRWVNSFENFLDDMGLKPTKKHTLDRIKNHKDYCPDNCRWASKKSQARNRRNTLYITVYGETKPLAQWAEEKGMSYQKLFRRAKKTNDPVRLFRP